MQIRSTMNCGHNCYWILVPGLLTCLTAVGCLWVTSRFRNQTAATAFAGTRNTPVEAEVEVHGIRIALASCSVEALGKVGAAWIAGAKEECKSSSNAHQDVENQHENTLWWRSSRGSFPDENPQATHRLGQSFTDCWAGSFYQNWARYWSSSQHCKCVSQPV